MSEEIITVISDTNHKTNHPIPKIGDKTRQLVDTLNVDDESKQNLIAEAQDILSHCIFPGTNDCITNIAVGYVQSGKTMSFTVLTALAADNGFRAVIYLTGTKTNLQDQTYKRLVKDINKIEDSCDYFHIFRDRQATPSNIVNFLIDEDYTLLLPILKHFKHISELAKVFKDPEVHNLLLGKAVLIIDDEADQSSFNTYAKSNSKKEDWEDNDYSRTYASINELKRSLPCHSYVQYTATPQAAFLIDNNDILSPKYFTLLTEGKQYTGGKFFFKDPDHQYVIEIPEKEVYHAKRNALTDRPASFERAMMQFLVSVAIVVRIQKRMDYLSMMVHIDGRQSSNEQFNNWTDHIIGEWSNMLRSDANDIARPAFEQKVRDAYDEITKYIEDKPSFDEVMKVMPKVIRTTEHYLIQGNTDNNIDWKNGTRAHILVGADMLNRGFTVEHLSMTYMPRTPRGKSTADTIEQRCRFFGYKRNYSDIVRIYLPKKSIEEFNAYVDHEETLRNNLRNCQNQHDFEQAKKVMIMDPILKPTRENILSTNLIRNKMVGWRQMRTVDKMQDNEKVINNFKATLTNWVSCADYGSPIRNHRVSRLTVEQFIALFKSIIFIDLPNKTRKIATIQYLEYLKDNGKIGYVDLYDMSCGEVRERKLDNNNLPINLQAGRSLDGGVSYPGDKEFKSEDTITFQLHHIKVKDSSSVIFRNTTFYNFAIYYPETLEQGYIASSGSEDDDEDEE